MSAPRPRGARRRRRRREPVGFARRTSDRSAAEDHMIRAASTRTRRRRLRGRRPRKRATQRLGRFARGWSAAETPSSSPPSSSSGGGARASTRARCRGERAAPRVDERRAVAEHGACAERAVERAEIRRVGRPTVATDGEPLDAEPPSSSPPGALSARSAPTIAASPALEGLRRYASRPPSAVRSKARRAGTSTDQTPQHSPRARPHSPRARAARRATCSSRADSRRRIKDDARLGREDHFRARA